MVLRHISFVSRVVTFGHRYFFAFEQDEVHNIDRRMKTGGDTFEYINDRRSIERICRI